MGVSISSRILLGLTPFADMTDYECLNKYARVYPRFVARPGEGQVTQVRFWYQWKEHFRMAAESKKLVVVNFMKPWCKECCSVDPELVQIAKKRRGVIFFKIHAHELKVCMNGTVAEEYKVEKVPAFVFLKEGKEVDRYVGSNIEDLQRKIDQHASVASSG